MDVLDRKEKGDLEEIEELLETLWKAPLGHQDQWVNQDRRVKMDHLESQEKGALLESKE
jgi:hypothetical protein